MNCSTLAPTLRPPTLLERDLAGNKRLLAEAREAIRQRDVTIEELRAELLKAWNTVTAVRGELDATKQKLVEMAAGSRRRW